MDSCCEVPCWSGQWFEVEGHGYMEISDLDERQHRPPPGWKLESVNISVANSSQIFRYLASVPAVVPVHASLVDDGVER